MEKKFGSKKFYVMTQNELYEQIKKCQKHEKIPCYYESWLEDSKILFSLDIDASADLDNEEFMNNSSSLFDQDIFSDMPNF